MSLSSGNLEQVLRLASEKLHRLDIRKLLTPFWESAWVAYLPVETMLFCLDQVVLTGKEGVSQVYVLLSVALLNHSADKMAAFDGDEDALQRYFHHCAGSTTPENLSAALLPYVTDLLAHLHLTPPQAPVAKVRHIPEAQPMYAIAATASKAHRFSNHGSDAAGDTIIGDNASGSPQTRPFQQANSEKSKHSDGHDGADDNRSPERALSTMSPFRESPSQQDLCYSPDSVDDVPVAADEQMVENEESRSRLHLLSPQIEMDVLDALSKLPSDQAKERVRVKVGNRHRTLPPIHTMDTVCEICDHAALTTEDVADQLLALGLVDDRDVGVDKIPVRVGYVEIALSVSKKECAGGRYNQLSRAVRRYMLHNDLLEQNLIASALASSDLRPAGSSI